MRYLFIQIGSHSRDQLSSNNLLVSSMVQVIEGQFSEILTTRSVDTVLEAATC